jgi:uncharacterized membrane protein YbhN (UPF0104 family)
MKSIIKKLVVGSLTLLFTGGTLAYVFVLLFQHWDEVEIGQYAFDWMLLLAALVFAVLNVVTLAYLWYRSMRIISGTSASFLSLTNIFMFGWLGRYLPGKIWSAASKVHLGARQGFDVQSLALSSIFDLALATLAQCVVVLLLIVFFIEEKYVSVPLLIAIVVIGFVVLRPRTIHFLLIRMLSFSKYDINASWLDRFSYHNFVVTTFAYVLPAIFVGAAFVFFVSSLESIKYNDMLILFFAFTAGNILGKVAFFAPAGIGVREGVLVLMLQTILPVGLSAFIALSSRLFFTIVDTVLFGLVYIHNKLQTRKI